ncbi:unnamed protein product [Prorocentrum cordatum]|uniref:Uncharacterized protein n=1 Tax=Prorocentrum cordatum TaxID=2364126 RepID=A0ABN9Y433_9DINO|nr:unnamed protein product [Polarella glacialis]
MATTTAETVRADRGQRGCTRRCSSPAPPREDKSSTTSRRSRSTPGCRGNNRALGDVGAMMLEDLLDNRLGRARMQARAWPPGTRRPPRRQSAASEAPPLGGRPRQRRQPMGPSPREQRGRPSMELGRGGGR